MSEETGESKVYEDGDVIFEQGDVGTEMYAIREGGVKIVRNEGGIEIALATLEAGDLFGEMSVLDEGPRSATAFAEGHTSLTVFSKELVEEAIRSNPEFSFGLMRILTERLRQIDEDLVDIAVRQVLAQEEILELGRHLYGGPHALN